ncbi:hypothetical protein KSF_066870 [Reticulibacter mediterranei]|uniref:FAD-binding domain-containing protein n=1 Tax=Reticulibacter mediterranei TaxID=2778369 RepID=A0A8J3N309_9CHLR|nr:FAD-dependent monooxygenase [Reticulibacter mediterranei]GHO96639.1 hypothetical protein KSF_066870 [Reticulibacter mediterranei]
MNKSYEPQKRTHAIVIGGGIAGLVVARVLVKYFEKVSLIERDHYPTEPVFRPGVLEGRQVHTMQLRGQQELERLFPGLKKKLLAHGAVERDYGNETHFYYGALCPKIPPVLHGWNCSRLLLEWTLYQEIQRFSHLNIYEGYEVTNLLCEQYEPTVRGVQMRTRDPLRNEFQEIKGDFIVDTSGAFSHAPQWLETRGTSSPQETVVNAFMGYATRTYKIPATFQAKWKGIAIQATSQQQRGGVLMEIEGKRWMAVLSGMVKDYPPTDETKFLEFARSLPDQELYEAIKEAQPISPIHGYRRTENRWRHFEQLEDQPENFLILGDAVCTFNPIYGQGMTVAVLQALALEQCLHHRRQRQRRLAQMVQKKVASTIAFPWRLATSADARFLSEENTSKKGFAHWYIEGVIALLPYDAHVLLAFLEVMHLVKGPAALLHPMILLKVLFSRSRKG